MHESPVCSHDFESREIEVSLFKIRTPCCAIVGLGELVSLILHKGIFNLTSDRTQEGRNGGELLFRNALLFVSYFHFRMLKYSKVHIF